MDPNPDKECENRGDIVLLSEIIAYSIYWQGIWNLKTLHFNNPSVYHYNLHDKQGSLITGYPWQVK